MAAREDQASILRGPARADDQWQARAGTVCALDACHRDWEHEQAICPTGHTSSSWLQRPNPAGSDLIGVMCSSKDCAPCPRRPACCRAQNRSPRRTRCLRPRVQFAALRAARQRASTAALGETDALRAGIAGTLARGIRHCRLHRPR